MPMLIQHVQKRDGRIVTFDLGNIERAVHLALKSVGNHDEITAMHIAYEVQCNLEEEGNSVPEVEHIQDVVERTLIHFDYAEAAKAYILYRSKRSEERNAKSAAPNVQVDVKDTIEEYLHKQDWRVNANANQDYSLGGLILNSAGKLTANYWLSHVYPEDIGQAHRAADIHIHDLDMFTGYCAGWSLRALLEEGFGGVGGRVASGPPRHLSSAVAQMINFLGTLQNEWAGAQAFSSFDTYLAPFVKKYAMELDYSLENSDVSFATREAKQRYIEDRTYKYVFQQMQSFVFNVNVPSRWGTQTPFTNITLDWNCPDDLKDRKLLLGGKEFAYTFGELEPEMKMINKAFIEVMTEGDTSGRAFTFPIPTYNITKDFDWDDPETLPLFEMTAKYGTPYFQNFVNSTLNPGDVRSMCCRLQLDLTELRKRGGGLFGSAEMTGSIGVVTINMARIGYQHAGNKEAFHTHVKKLMQLGKQSLELKRETITYWFDRGLYPYTKRYLPSFHNHFSTIGLNGLNEAIMNFTEGKEHIGTDFGQQFATEVLDMMRTELQEYQKETGHFYNLEATPAEGTTYRFAKEDKKRFKDIIQAGTKDAPYYTNSSQLPVGFTDDVFAALDKQDSLQTMYTGGTVFHAYLGERLPSAASCRALVKAIVSNYRLPYITITPTFSICPKHGYLAGEHDYCPRCDEEIGLPPGVSTLDTQMRRAYETTHA